MAVGDTGLAEVLQNAAAATGNGTAIDFKSYHHLTLDVTGTFTATVTFEGTIDDSNWVAIGLLPSNNGAAVTTATAAGMFKLPVDMCALSQVRARISAYTSGSVTVKSRKEYR